jgi:hypothetical protein
MNLTEPHCGTDLGLMRTKAEPQRRRQLPDHRHQDLHLGRRTRHGREHHPSGAGQDPRRVRKASRASACSWCRSSWSMTDGSLGARNGVSCGSIEHKMGIHGNSTCVLNYDNAKGWLVGEMHKGMQAMFVMMNAARLGVGMQGLSAKPRSPTRMRSPTPRTVCRAARSPAPRTRKSRPTRSSCIPDVRRMLMTIKAFVEGSRALGPVDRHRTRYRRQAS